ncbi:MAG: T9SS type A sorting domain-containing protein [Cyclobacteriaceae bacterium]
MKFKLLLSCCLVLAVFSELEAQGVITIDHKTKRYLGEVSTLDRSKYVNGHFLFNATDAEFEAFKTQYNIEQDFIGGRQFWNPFGKVKNGVIPNINKKYSGVREVSPSLVATGTASHLMYDDNLDYSVEDVTAFSLAAAEYVAHSYRDDWTLVPKYIEPFNEPMVHAIDYYPEGRNGQYITSKLDEVITKICVYHRDLGQAIHAVPELENMRVLGFASAYPELENNNFDLWNTRWKKFIDIAGEDLDGFSVHLYDGSGINNSGGRRSGSNSEAILDMIETYSFIKLGEVKPIAVTEYGRLVPNQPGWQAGNGTSNYEPVENSQAVRSQLHFSMNFMERGDNLDLSIPFNVNTRNSNSQYTKSSIWVNNTQGKAELTNRRFFYEMWKDLKGERVRINSTNIDIQTQAFVDDTKLYIMLNNLNDELQTVDLNLFDEEGLTGVDIKSLKIFLDKEPELTKTTLTEAPKEIQLEYGETAILTYSFDAPIEFENTIRRTKYYSTSYLQPISKDVGSTFSFDGVVVGSGEATLRLSVGRSHGMSLSPSVSVNGMAINLEGDVIRGYNQENRKQFFGTLEIPFDIDLLKDGVNEVTISFPDNGGYVSSVILSVELSEKPLNKLPDVILKEESSKSLMIYPNPIRSGERLNLNIQGADLNFKIFAIDGSLILNGQGNSVKTSEMNPGVYLIQVVKNGVIRTTKLIVE